MTVYSLFTTCSCGLEEPLVAELQALSCADVRSADGGVSCWGAMEQVYRTNLWSHVVSRVLLRLAKGGCRNEYDIYKLARNIDWAAWFALEQASKVKAEGKRTNVKSLDLVGLKIKDALCDAFCEAYDIRPSADKVCPDMRVHAFVGGCEVQTFLDILGETLSKRGYRQDTGEAPLCENLAAGLLLLAGYDGMQPFQDPFCGSDTIVIEVTWTAAGCAPGLTRRFGFEKLKNFDRGAWEEIRRQTVARIKPSSATLSDSDNDRRMIHTAQANVQTAETGGWTEWDVCDTQVTRPNGEGGIMIFNPFYGAYLAEIQVLQTLYLRLGTWLKQHYVGWLTGMFTADRSTPKFMCLSLRRKTSLYNGNLDYRPFLMDMVEGSNR